MFYLVLVIMHMVMEISTKRFLDSIVESIFLQLWYFENMSD